MKGLIIPSIIIIILFLFIFTSCNQKKDEKFQVYHKPCVTKLENKCYNDPLTLDKCWITKDWPCPRYNGSFMQCTNNYKRDVNIADCLERTYYYSAKDERLSEKCVYKDVFPFALKKDIPDNTKPSIFPRVNMWRNEELPDNFFNAI